MLLHISNKVRLEGISHGFRSFLREHYVIPNPEYITRVKLNKWLGGCPKELKLYEEDGDAIILPYGCLQSVYIYMLNCVDMTTVVTTSDLNRDAKADWEGSNIIPRDYQLKAVNAMYMAKFGVLKAPCSSGKTVMGHLLAAKTGMKTLWLTHTKELLNQSKAVGQLILGNQDGRVGTVTDGKANWGDTITYATVQTMVKLDPKEYKRRFNCVIVDECFPATTTIETKDGIKTLDCVTIGDVITSYNTKTGKVENKPVTHVFKLKAHNIVTVVLSNGKRIVCTSNHPFYTQSGEWKKAEELGVSDYVMQLLPQGVYERRIFDWFRVESVQVQEPTSDGTFGGLCPDGYVYNIEVADNNNYFADGVLVHNCHRCNTKKASSQMSFVVNSIAAEYKYGLSATPETLDGYGKTVFCNLGDIKYEIPRSELECNNTIMPVDIIPVFTNWTYPQEAMRANGTLDFQEAVKYMACDTDRNRQIIDLIGDKPTLILSNNIDHLCYMINELSDEQASRACLISTKHDDEILTKAINSKHTDKARAEYIDMLRDGRLDIMFATYQLAKEGLNIPRLEQVIMAFPAVDGNIITQSVGRVARASEGKYRAICYDVVDRPTYFRKKWRQRVKLYKENGNQICDE